jgi:hypothetical protein
MKRKAVAFGATPPVVRVSTSWRNGLRDFMVFMYIGTGTRPQDAGAMSTIGAKPSIWRRKMVDIGTVHQLNSLRFLPGSWAFTWS